MIMIANSSESRMHRGHSWGVGLIKWGHAGLTLVVAMFLLAGCATEQGPKASRVTPLEKNSAAIRPVDLNETIRLGTFNIQNFGDAKGRKPEVMAMLASMVGLYDVMAVQEVSNPKVTAPLTVQTMIRQAGRHYGLCVSPSTGLQDDDKASRESYAFYWNEDKVRLVGEPRLFDDRPEDLFQREPYLARFASLQGNLTFVLIDVHTAPDRAVAEIGELDTVVQWARTQWPDEDDFVVVGDFNASGTYARPAQLDLLSIRGPAYQWIVPDDADSTVAQSVRAYDRMVITANSAENYAGQWGVDRVFEGNQVSDHYPVWANFYIRRDTGK